MDLSTVITVFLIAALAGFAFITARGKRGGVNRCTRCNGTGEIDEHWPDPDKPGGWHHMTGVCPKCKGKGKV